MKDTVQIANSVQLQISWEKMGNDLAVTVCGGDRAHIGSVALAIPRESLRGTGERSATTSVLNVTGHKDGEISVRVADLLATELNCVVTVACGIHVDRISGETLDALLRSPEVIAERIRTKLAE